MRLGFRLTSRSGHELGSTAQFWDWGNL